MEVLEAVIPGANRSEPALRMLNVQKPAGRRALREHHHPAFEIVLFKSGSGIFHVAGKNYDIQAGDIFIFGSHEAHCFTEIGDDPEMSLMNVNFLPHFIWSSGNDFFDAKYLKIFFCRNERFENRLDRANPARAEIRALLLAMEAEFAGRAPDYPQMVKALLLRILVLLSRSFDSVTEDEDDLNLYKQHFARIEKAAQYIRQNLAADISLGDVAQAANLSRAYFSTVFKRLYGISPWDYITAKRIEQAIALLDDKSLTILEIAFRCGYNSTANFNHAFKKVTRRTPSEYRLENASLPEALRAGSDY